MVSEQSRWEAERHPWQRYEFEGSARIRSKWLTWAKDKAAPAELGFACQTLRQTALAPDSKTNPKMGGASVLLKPQAQSKALCVQQAEPTDTPCQSFKASQACLET